MVSVLWPQTFLEKYDVFSIIAMVNQTEDIMRYFLQIIRGAGLFRFTPVWNQLALLVIGRKNQSELMLANGELRRFIFKYQVSSIKYSYLMWGTVSHRLFKWHPQRKKERKMKSIQKE